MMEPWEKFSLCQKWHEWDIWGPKANIFELLSKSPF